MKKIFNDSQLLEQKVPDAELVPVARVICSTEEQQLPVAKRGCSSLLLCVLSESRRDSRQFIVTHLFDNSAILQCFRQAHQDVFGMVELVTLVEYIVRRMRSALHEEWTEDKV